MTKNRKSILIGGLLVALVVTVLAGVGVSSVYAQSPAQVTVHGPGPGGGLSLTGLQIAAQKLGMTTDELITALQSGKTLEQIAQEKGVDFATNGWVGLALIATWLVMAFTTRYSSMSAIVTTLASPLYVWWFTREPVLIAATAVMGVMLLWRHRSNIQKLVAGTETKIGK